MHTQVLGVAAAGALSLAVAVAVVPSVASAQSAHPVPLRVVALSHRPARVSSHSAAGADRGALNAYLAYLSTLATDETSSAARDQQLVDGVTNTCSGALDDLGGLSAGQLSEKALTAFSDEVDADLDLAYMAVNKAAVTKFADALGAVSWPTATEDRTMARLSSSERALEGVGASSICSDATALAAAPLSEPTATVRFLRRYNAASGSLRASLSAFQLLLSKYETTAEKKLISQIDSLVSGFSGQSAATEQADASTVLSVLGVPSGS